MHQVLYIQELVINICKCLHADIEQSQASDNTTRPVARIALVSLAQTCHMFHDPAIHSLWAFQDSLHPVILRLGDSVVETEVVATNAVGTGVPPSESSRSYHKVMTYVHPPSEAQISCFVKYARLVRTIQLFDRLKMDPKILDILLSLSWSPSIHTHSRLALFPNLRELSWGYRASDPQTDDLMCLFVGPKLSELLGHPTSGSSMELTLDALRHYMPPLKTFDWRTRPASPSSFFLIEACLCPRVSEKLTRVDLQYFFGVTSAIWVMLSKLPHLEELDSRIPIRDPEGRSVEFSRTHFPLLNTLRLYSEGGRARKFEDFAAELMPVDRRPYRLQSLLLDCEEPFTKGNATYIIQEMVEVCDRNVLESFRLNVGYCPVDSRTRSRPDIVPASLTPLLDLPSLEDLTLWPMKSIDLDNQALETMARAWPNLQKLDLPWEDEKWVKVPKLTLEGLISLAQFCPHLHTLWITVGPHVSVPDELQRRVDQMTFRNSMGTIYFNRGRLSDWENADRVARFLRTLFPQLHFVEWYRDDDDIDQLWADTSSDNSTSSDESDGSAGSTVDEGSSGRDYSRRNIWDLVKEIIQSLGEETSTEEDVE